MNRLAMLSLVTLCLSAPHDLYAQGGAPTGDVRYIPGDVEVGDKSYPYIVLPPLEVVEGEEYPLFLLDRKRVV